MGNEMGHALVLSAGCKGSSCGMSLVHDAVARMEDANWGWKGRGSAEGRYLDTVPQACSWQTLRQVLGPQKQLLSLMSSCGIYFHYLSGMRVGLEWVSMMAAMLSSEFQTECLSDVRISSVRLKKSITCLSPFPFLSVLSARVPCLSKSNMSYWLLISNLF